MSDETYDITPVNLGWYQHYKGGIYEVIASALNTETGETMHVYRDSVQDHFTRSHSSFTGIVTSGGSSVPRFRWLGKTETQALLTLHQFSKAAYELSRSHKCSEGDERLIEGDACPACGSRLYSHRSGDLHCSGCKFIDEVK